MRIVVAVASLLVMAMRRSDRLHRLARLRLDPRDGAGETVTISIGSTFSIPEPYPQAP